LIDIAFVGLVLIVKHQCMVMKYLKLRTLPLFLPTDDGIKYCLLCSYYLIKVAVSAAVVHSLKLYVKQTKKLEYASFCSTVL